MRTLHGNNLWVQGCGWGAGKEAALAQAGIRKLHPNPCWVPKFAISTLVHALRPLPGRRLRHMLKASPPLMQHRDRLNGCIRPQVIASTTKRKPHCSEGFRSAQSATENYC